MSYLQLLTHIMGKGLTNNRGTIISTKETRKIRKKLNMSGIHKVTKLS